MRKSCPECGTKLTAGAAIAVQLGFARKCRKCRCKLATSSFWTFTLSIVIVFALIASFSFVNLFGMKGFVLVGLVPITIWILGSFFVPVVCIRKADQ